MRKEPVATPMPFGPRGGHGVHGQRQRMQNPSVTLRRIWGYLGTQRAGLIGVAVLVVLSTLLGLVGPYLMGRAIDGYIGKHDLVGLRVVCLGMLAAYASSSLLNWLQGFLMVGIAQRAILNLRNDLYRKLQTLPVRFFDTQSHGDLMSRLTNDVERLSSVLTDSVSQIIAGLLSMVGILIAMLLLSPALTFVTVVSLGGMSLFFNKVVAKKIGEGFRGQQASLGMLNGIVQESVSGQRVIKAFGQEPMWRDRFDQANADLRVSSTQAQSFASLIGPLMNGSNNLALALVAGVGGWLVVQGIATVGAIAAFINYARMFGRPLNDIANLIGSVEAALAGAERVFDMIDREPEVDSEESGEPLVIRGEVTFQDVTFGYDASNPVLKHVSLHAKPGETIALIGPTGAGKTTIVNLLTRFYEIDAGTICIEGKDIREIPKASLRRQLGIVLQDSFLFAGTVRENLRYGKLDATDEEIVAAATMANADAFIRHLPHGYDTVLSERASNLSQGQRQLLSIARTLLADPQILILDEATSSVDTRTERHIQEAMLRLMQGRTCFVIAHRLSTIRDADQILVLRGGEVVERGDHDSLLAQAGFYAGMIQNPSDASSSL